MKENPYNLIAFQSDSYTQTVQLSTEPAPDTLLRVFMAWKPLESAVDISKQNLTAPVRTGFTAVRGAAVKLGDRWSQRTSNFILRRTAMNTKRSKAGLASYPS